MPAPGAAPPPVSWARHFPASEYSPDDRRALLIADMAATFRSPAGWALLAAGAATVLDAYAVALDYQALLGVAGGTADLMAALDMLPEEGLACLAAAAFEVLFAGSQPCGEELFGEGAPPGDVAVRLWNHPGTLTTIRALKSSSIGKLVTIKGTVVRVSRVKPLVTRMSFACGKCGEAAATAAFADGKFELPTRCPTLGCRGKSFAPMHSTAVATDWQKVRVQEVVGADRSDNGRVPRSVEVELRGDLVDSCSAGDVVTVMAVVKVMNAQASKGGGGGGKGGNAGKAQSAMFLLYLDAVSVRSERRGRRGAEQGGPQQAGAQPPGAQQTQQQQEPFSLRDLQFIVKFSQETEGEQFRHLVHAMCPQIFGNEMVKAGLLLALAGGVRKHTQDKNKVPTRGDIHVLLVGDPGQGKSQMLQATAAAAPRGLYVSANTSTNAGLTVSVVRDAVTGDYAFEAGALVLGDQGVCCVDEFDKMAGDHKALLEAMEQQEVSVAKAGLVANLPARTSVLAAANPAGGHYNRGKTVVENLKMSDALLSRFDLIFIMMDRPDEDLDARLSEHVMALHSGVVDRAKDAHQRLLAYPRAAAPLLLPSGEPGGQPTRLPLVERLKAYRAEDGPPLPVPLLRKYISYARQFVTPRVGEEAQEVLRDFFLELRRSVTPNDGTPVTARQLESLVRLAEARARLELREEVTREDAEDVVEIMKAGLHDKFQDDYEVLDFRSAGGKSTAAEGKRYLGALRRAAERRADSAFTLSELYAIADDLEVQVPDLGDLIEELNAAGELLKKGPGQYKLAPSGASSCPESSYRKRRR